jgi:hypothetical protein
MAPLQTKRFKVGSKMATAATAPVLPNQKKQCFKIARFTDAPCISVRERLKYLLRGLCKSARISYFPLSILSSFHVTDGVITGTHTLTQSHIHSVAILCMINSDLPHNCKQFHSILNIFATLQNVGLLNLPEHRSDIISYVGVLCD